MQGAVLGSLTNLSDAVLCESTLRRATIDLIYKKVNKTVLRKIILNDTDCPLASFNGPKKSSPPLGGTDFSCENSWSVDLRTSASTKAKK